MSAPEAGALRRRLRLEAPLDAPDEIGGATRGWTCVATLWAHVASLRGLTRLQGERLEQAITHRVTIRWRADVTGETRLTMGERVFAVRAARDPDEGRRVLVLDCEETTP
jgi:SPP1 family predicted phage head-tail adaptor